jgi:tRNA A22 N-methylase
MADEIRSSVAGPNGERLQVQVGTKSVGITTRDIVTVITLAILAVGGYVMMGIIGDGLKAIYRELHIIQDELRQNKDELRKMLSTHEWNQGREPGERLPLELSPPASHQER